MVAADDDGRLQFAGADHLVEGEAQAVALAEADPADPRGEALEGDALARHVEPGVQVRVVGDQLLHLGVGAVDVLGVARERRPAERADAAAEERADVGGDEAGEGEGVLQPLFLGHLADVVAVVEGRDAGVPEVDHRRDVHLHAGAGRPFHRLGVGFALLAPFGEGPALGQIAVDGIVRRGLVGDDVGADAAPNELGEDVGGVAEEADGFRLAGPGPARDHRERLVEGVGAFVEVSGADAEVDGVGVAFDREAGGAGQDRGERLRAAHAAEAGGQDPAALEVAAVVLAAGLDEGLEGALHDALGADVDPGAGGHLAVHHQALAVELVEMRPGRPVRHEVGVGDQDARRVGMGPEDADRLAGLDEEGFVVVERAERGDDAVEVLPGAGGAADAAVDDELVRVLGHVGGEVVHQHPERGLGEPALGADLGAGRGVDVAGVLAGGGDVGHGQSFRSGATSARVSRTSRR